MSALSSLLPKLGRKRTNVLWEGAYKNAFPSAARSDPSHEAGYGTLSDALAYGGARVVSLELVEPAIDLAS